MAQLGQHAVVMPFTPAVPTPHLPPEAIGLLQLAANPKLAKTILEHQAAVEKALAANEALVAKIRDADKLDSLLEQASERLEEAKRRTEKAATDADAAVEQARDRAAAILKEAEAHAEKVNARQRELEAEADKVQRLLEDAEAQRTKAEAVRREVEAEKAQLVEVRRRHEEKEREFDRAVEALKGRTMTSSGEDD